MKNIAAYSTVFVLMTLLLGGCYKSDTPTSASNGVISGQVFDETTQNPLYRVFIVTEPPTESVTTSLNGNFTIYNVRPGLYTIIAQKAGYYINRVNVRAQSEKTTSAHIPLRQVKVDNNPPDEPVILFPNDGGLVDEKKFRLFWTCNDPDGNKLTYDIYLGESKPPAIYTLGLKDTSVFIEDLADSSSYFCKVIAKDEHGATSESIIVGFRVAIGKGMFNGGKYDAGRFYPDILQSSSK